MFHYIFRHNYCTLYIFMKLICVRTKRSDYILGSGSLTIRLCDAIYITFFSDYDPPPWTGHSQSTTTINATRPLTWPDQTIQQVNATTTIMPRTKRTSLSLKGTRKSKRMHLMRAAHNDGHSTTNVRIDDTQVSHTTRPATATLPSTTRWQLSRSRDAERSPMRITRATDTRTQKHAVLSCCLPVSAIGNIFNHDVTVSLCEGERERGGAILISTPLDSTTSTTEWTDTIKGPPNSCTSIARGPQF